MLVTQLCLTLCDPMDCSLPSSSVLGIFQARIVELVLIPFYTGSSWPGIKPRSPAIQENSLVWATREALVLQRWIIFSYTYQFSTVQSFSHFWHFATPWTAALQASLSITNSRSLLKLMSIESVMLSDHLNFCCPLLLLPSIFPSFSVFSSESVLCIRWPKYWSFSFSIRTSKEYSGWISFRIDWFDLLAVQGTLKSVYRQHSSK